MRKLFARELTWIAIYLLVVAIATGICVHRECNNFLIFRSAFRHLRIGQDLYAFHPGEHLDLFKYSPTFALLFAPFAALPFGVALFAWNFLNVFLLYVGLRLVMPPSQRLLAVQLMGVGLVTTVDGTQSNGLVAALIILAFAALERDRLFAAATAIAAGALIKVFPLAAVAFAAPRRDRWRFAAYVLAAGATFIALPLIVTDANALIAQYRSWYAMGAVDALDRGASVMRLLNIAVGYSGPNWVIQLSGTVLLMLPILLRPSRWRDPEFRRVFLASLLMYSVIFNHKAEQPSFIIGLAGVAIWYASGSPSAVRNVLAGSTLAATVPILMAVIGPGLISTTVEGPLLVASACCTATWFIMQGELLDLFPSGHRRRRWRWLGRLSMCSC